MSIGSKYEYVCENAPGPRGKAADGHTTHSFIPGNARGARWGQDMAPKTCSKCGARVRPVHEWQEMHTTEGAE